MSDVQGKMADPAILYQCSVCGFTSDDWQYFLKHLRVDYEGNILPLLGKWEKRMNVEKTVPDIHDRNFGNFAQMNRAHTSRFPDYSKALC